MIKIETDHNEVQVYQNGVLLPAADAVKILRRLLKEESDVEGAALLREYIACLEKDLE